MSQEKKTKKKRTIKGIYTDQELGVLKNVNKRLSLLVDYQHQLKSGIVRGIGFAIGASIIGAIVVAIILNFVKGIDIQFVNDLIKNAESSTNSNE